MAKKSFEGIGDADSKFIEVEVDENGDAVKIEAHGYNGLGCQEATAGLERALGAVVNRTEKGPEQRTQQRIGFKS